MRTRQRLEMVRLPPGATNFPFHSHAAEWEFHLIISGQGKMRTRRKTTPLKPGDCVLHPPGEAHHMVNTGHEDLALRVERSDSTLRQTRPTDSGFWGQCACGSFHVHLILAFWICFALQLEMNALNTVWDLFLKLPYKDGRQALNTWNIAGLKTAVRLDGTWNDPRDTDKSWSVELALPWTALAEYAHRPSPPRDGDQWRVNFSRVAWAHRIVSGKYRKVPNTREDNWVWSPQGIIDMHRPEKWGYVQFCSGKPGEVKFAVDPAVAAQEALLKFITPRTSSSESARRGLLHSKPWD